MTYEKVKALLNKGGVSRPTLFEVIIPQVFGINRGVNDQLEFLCKNAPIPEVSVQTVVALGHDAQGVTREVPANVTFAKPFTITVISDAQYTVYKGLRRWFDSVVSNANPISGGPLASQRANYYDGVSKRITIKKLELSGGAKLDTPFIVTLNNAFPVNMGSINLDTTAQNQALEFDVQFYYETLTFTG